MHSGFARHARTTASTGTRAERCKETRPTRMGDASWSTLRDTARVLRRSLILWSDGRIRESKAIRTIGNRSMQWGKTRERSEFAARASRDGGERSRRRAGHAQVRGMRHG